MIPNYIIVEGSCREALMHHVNEAIRNGYRPTGGTMIRENGYQDLWYQAMIHKDLG